MNAGTRQERRGNSRVLVAKRRQMEEVKLSRERVARK